MKITGSGLLQAAVAVVVILAALRFGQCADENAQAKVEAAEADIARARVARDSALRLLADSSARWAAERDSVDALLRDAQQRAALFSFQRDSLNNELLAAVPDSLRPLVEQVGEACRAQVGAVEEALGLCAQARVSLARERDAWKTASDSLYAQIIEVEDDRLDAERRAARAEKRGIACGPGAGLTFRGSAFVVACIYEGVRFKLPNIPLIPGI